MATDHNDAPPAPASFISTIDRTSTADSKITAVSVYSGRAEVTRVFKFSVKIGQNHVNLNGLPNVLDAESVRVEGHGPVTIHDVTVGIMPDPPEPDTPPALKELKERRERVTKALGRSNEMRKALDKYIGTLDVEHVKAGELERIVEGFESSGGKVDEKILGMEKELKTIEEEISKEEEKLYGDAVKKDNTRQLGAKVLFTDSRSSSEKNVHRHAVKKDKNWRLGAKVSLSLFAEKESEVELILIYAVLDASWSAVYDVRVDMQASEAPITIIYKAAITQDTAEDWEDVPLTLETATPTFQVGIPTLNTWTLSVYRPTYRSLSFKKSESVYPSVNLAPPAGGAAALSDEDRSFDLFGSKSKTRGSIRFRDATVSSKGNVSATFTVPGTITIPSDDIPHNVTITQLKMDATMSWIVVPKLDARARLSAKITNASEYSLLSGSGSIYVDGSFISKSTIPAVSPGESFDCALGLDPAIRITYHPVTKKVAQIGFYTKTTINAFSQRISKSITITDLRIIDQIPVSCDEKIGVKLVYPALPAIPVRNDGSVKGEKKVDRASLNPRMKVSQGVAAEWGDGLEDPASIEDGTATLGQDGKMSWICEIPSQGKTVLLLQWEVTAPSRTTVDNL